MASLCLMSSHYLSLISPYRFLYVTHASRALQSHDLSGEGIKLWITYILSDHTRTWRASPYEWSARCRGHLWDSTNMKDNTHQAYTHSYQQGEYGMMITGTLWAKSFPTFVLQVRKNPEKNLTQETCPGRGSNPGPLRDRRTCYHLLHSGGHVIIHLRKFYHPVSFPTNWKLRHIIRKTINYRLYCMVVKLGLSPWEEHKLRLFENKVLRKIFGAKKDEMTGELRKLHNAELHPLYSSPNIIKSVKSRRLRWAGHVAHMEQSRNAYRVLVGKPEGKRPLGRPRRR